MHNLLLGQLSHVAVASLSLEIAIYRLSVPNGYALITAATASELVVRVRGVS